ncbi:MAG: efflux RND transporter periplasmic adaptor subunit [Desulfobulbaceae bacterium]|nr:efflux RND transporter periplasmic adaptor subunit [Desulfobulbaceae bacterium]HIJ78823.1 efflux RND transporter periplasmic adaptor subunit [Deltaproteobacteria bacterium]
MPRLKRYVIVLACVLLMLAGCKEEQHEAGQQAPLATVQVKVAPVSYEASKGQIEVLGTVEPVERAVIAAKVTGTIAKMPVVLGSTVKAGQLLVEISANEIAAKLRQAQAQLEQAQRNLDRETRLLAQNASTPETVKSMQEAHRIAQAGHREAQTLVGYTTITAPFAGQITVKPVNVGDLATPGVPLLVLENNRRLQVVTAVPEALVVNIHRGDKLMVRIPAADLVATGTVAEVAPAADPASRTAPVKIDIASSDKLRSGQFARISLAGEGGRTLFIPASAVIPFGQMERVFVARDNKAELRLVRIGMQQGNMVEILSGLNPDEQVVVVNGTHLIDGQPLEIMP